MKIFVTVVFSFMLVACGYSPVYQQTKELTESVHVARVSMVAIIKTAGERRIAQLANKRLSQVFIAQDNASYELNVDIKEYKNTLAVLRDATEARLEVELIAQLVLEDDQGEKVFERELKASAPYNVETSPYGTDAGKERARKSAAISLTEEVIQQVNYFLYTQK